MTTSAPSSARSMRWRRTKHAILTSSCSTHPEFCPKSAVTEAIQAIKRIVSEPHIRAVWIVDEREVANRVVGVIRGAFGSTPAAGEAVVGVVSVNQNHRASLVQLVCHAAKLIVVPAGGLVFAVGQREKIA